MNTAVEKASHLEAHRQLVAYRYRQSCTVCRYVQVELTVGERVTAHHVKNLKAKHAHAR